MSQLRQHNEEVLSGVPQPHRLARRRQARARLSPASFRADQLSATSGIQPAIACEGDEHCAIRGLISAGVRPWARRSQQFADCR
jgi:hypothetical protein